MKVAGEYRDIFGAGNYFLEIQDHGLEDQIQHQHQLLQMSRNSKFRSSPPTIRITSTKKIRIAHDILLCIQTNRTVNETERMKFGGESFYVKSPEEMMQVFQDLPHSLHERRRNRKVAATWISAATLIICRCFPFRKVLRSPNTLKKLFVTDFNSARHNGSQQLPTKNCGTRYGNTSNAW